MPKPTPGAAIPQLKKAAAAAADKIGAKLPPGPFGKPGGGPSQAALSAARARVDALLAAVKRSPAGQSREVALLNDYLVEFIARGGTFEEFAADMRERARAAVRQHRHVIMQAVNLARLFRPAEVCRRYRTEVVMPARSRSITGAEAWRRTDAIVGRNVRSDPETKPSPQWTIYPGVSADMSALVGLQYSAGICGLAHGMVCYAYSGTVSIGAQAGVGFVAAINMSPCPPLDLGGVALTVGVGIAAGAGFDVGVGLVPKAFLPGKSDEMPTLSSVLDGFSVGISGGTEIELSIGVEFASVVPLIG